jgi:hypothetical protein
VRRNGIRALRDLEAGTLVRLPDEIGRLVGYAEGGGSARVLVPAHNRLDAFELPAAALVEVIATPRELAASYLRGTLAAIDRRWRRRARPRGPEGRRDTDGEAA